VVLLHSAHLRLLDGLIDGLLARGAQVRLAFTNRHKPPFGPPRIDPAQPQLMVDDRPVPRRSGPWAGFARALRRVNDYLRYLDPGYAGAGFLRRRSAERLPPAMAWLRRWPQLPRALLLPLRALAAAAERLVPTAPETDAYLTEATADLVLVSPLVDYDSGQVDLVKSARQAGIPVALCVGSWDHLTTKSLIHARPDRVFVWNQAQKREALAYHRLAAHEVEVVGATALDHWFARTPARPREALCALLGLPAGKPFVVYACSSSQICGPHAEADFIASWLEGLRRHPRLAGIGVVVRPHPQNMAYWRGADPARFDCVVHPQAGANPIDAEDKAEYFDTLHHAAAVVGINTSAMVEAAVIGRPALTILADQFNQGSTLHFRHLAPENGGCLTVARDLDEHFEQLAAALDDPAGQALRLAGFVGRFIRPCGRDLPAAERLAEAAIELARRPRRRRPAVPALLRPLSRALGRRLQAGSVGGA